MGASEVAQTRYFFAALFAVNITFSFCKVKKLNLLVDMEECLLKALLLLLEISTNQKQCSTYFRMMVTFPDIQSWSFRRHGRALKSGG
jgi:hypothetical protein